MPGPVSSQGGRRAGQIGGEILPAVMRKRGGADCSRVQFFLGWWPLLFSQEWWGHIWYVVYGSPAVCCWREPIVSRILSRNRRPTVLRVLDPDKIFGIGAEETRRM
jgi:hypothetical protein